MFAIHQRIDRAVLRPAALGYRHAVPKPVRTGLRHFFSNLGEPIVFLNYLLQLKPGKAIETAARFVVNSTVGLAGVIDVAKAKPVRLPHRPNGFGDTLGFYGVKPGPYLFLPLLGPTDLRDLLGGQADGLVLPLAVGGELNRARFEVPRAVLTGLDLREQSDDDLRALLGDAVDPYATLRSVFLQDRAGEIAALHGRRADAAPDDPLADPAAGAATPELADPLADPAVGVVAPPPARELADPLADPAAPAQRDGGPEAPRK